MKDVPAVQTSDGQVFTDRDAAEKHEIFLQTQDAINAFIDHTYSGDGRGSKASSTRARTVLFQFIGWLHDNGLTVGKAA